MTFVNLPKITAKFLVLFFIVSSCVFAGDVEMTDARSDGKGCYGYLTDMVRSSNFPFRYTTKDKINLLIDNDNGEHVLAQLRYKTSGEGIIGWVTYYVRERVLVNSSADLEDQVELNFDKKYAGQYEKCVLRLGSLAG